jgi:hypothetical protein
MRRTNFMSNINVDGNGYMLNVIQRIYKTKRYKVKTEEGEEEYEQHKFVKEVRVKRWFLKDSITAVEEYYGSNNKPAKRRCIIYDRYTGKDFPVAHSMSDIIELFNVKSNKVGYGSSI